MTRYYRLASLAIVSALVIGMTVVAQPPRKDGDGKGDGRGGAKADSKGKGRPGGGGFGGGFGGFAMPKPGQIMTTNVQTTLKLTDEQKKQVDDLQKEVDAKLAKILTEEQQKQLKEMGERGGGGFGGFGGGGRRPGGEFPGGIPKKRDN